MLPRKAFSALASLFSAVSLAAGAPEAAGNSTAASPARTWTDKGSLSLVSTSGNSKGESLGFSNEFLYSWSNASLAVNFGGVRIETTTTVHAATGLSTNPGGYVLSETEAKTLTSDSYFANGRYDRRFTGRFFGFGSLAWETNKPAGLESRSRAILGVGMQWLDTSETKLRTDLGVGFTKERPVFATEGYEENHGTWQVSGRVEQKLWAASFLTSEAAYIGNTKDTDDHLVTWRTSLSTKLSDHLALKIGYDLAYKNKPNAVGVPVMSILNPGTILGLVPVAAKKTDTMFTTSLVINF